jgi:hypothetical protein
MRHEVGHHTITTLDAAHTRPDIGYFSCPIGDRDDGKTWYWKGAVRNRNIQEVEAGGV